MNRQQILDAAANAVLKDRQSSYGPPENSFQAIAQLWAVYLDARLQRHDDGTLTLRPLESHDVAAMLVLLKVARIAINPQHTDSWIDVAGYGACGGELTSQPIQNVMDFAGPMQGEPSKESCKPATRNLKDSISESEAIKVASVAHRLLGATIKQWSIEESALLMDAMLRPTTLSYGEFVMVMSLIPHAQ